MKVFVNYFITLTLTIFLSYCIFRITFEIIECILPSKRFNLNGEPEFVMPTVALLVGFITSIIFFILSFKLIYRIIKNFNIYMFK